MKKHTKIYLKHFNLLPHEIKRTMKAEKTVKQTLEILINVLESECANLNEVSIGLTGTEVKSLLTEFSEQDKVSYE